jgi:hypothetical protein
MTAIIPGRVAGGSAREGLGGRGSRPLSIVSRHELSEKQVEPVQQ